MKQKDINILLVEDNPDDIELTLEAFKNNNLANKITVARDGEEALDIIFGNKDKKPDIILLDLKLPKVDGLEILRRVKSDEDTRVIPVIILTSSKEESDLIKSYKLGVNSYIRKPVDFKEFIKVVKELGLYWLIVNELPPKYRTQIL